MNKKDRDLKKLKLYTKALGLKVRFKKAKRNSPNAEWTVDKTITFYLKAKTTKRRLILDWIHELLHEYDFRERHKNDPEMLYDALAAEDARRNSRDAKVDKSMRKLIYEDEVRAAGYRQQIRRQLDLESITESELDIDIKLDIWIYKYYYDKGNFPTIKETEIKLEELKRAAKKNLKKSTHRI